jgi:hypothetical protein
MKNEEIATCLTCCLTSTYITISPIMAATHPRKTLLLATISTVARVFLTCHVTHLLGIMALEYGGLMYCAMAMIFAD